MKFKLLYDGPLRNNHPGDKRLIREAIRPQLAELWAKHRALSDLSLHTEYDVRSDGEQYFRTRLDIHADKYVVAGMRFVPLVSAAFGLSCVLDILLLRREQPGRVIMQSGDIDNRIKTLFDGLRMPTNAEEAGTISESQLPYFCLLESDTLIDEIRVSTDMLLLPPASPEEQNHVRVIIGVETTIVDASRAYAEFEL